MRFTKAHLTLFSELLKGKYLRHTTNNKGKGQYKLYEGNQKPVRWVKNGVMRNLTSLLKQDKKGRLTLNLSNIRQLHGNTLPKKIYKQSKPKKTKFLSRSIEFDEKIKEAFDCWDFVLSEQY